MISFLLGLDLDVDFSNRARVIEKVLIPAPLGCPEQLLGLTFSGATVM